MFRSWTGSRTGVSVAPSVTTRAVMSCSPGPIGRTDLAGGADEAMDALVP